MIVVPPDQLSPDVLQSLIEEFVTRHGAIQGEDTPLPTKITQVRQLLKTGKAVIVWDDESESATILLKEDLNKQEPQRTVEKDPEYYRDDVDG